MAGKIVADTLEHSTAGSIATNYVVDGSAKAWVNFNGTGTIAVRDSLNVSGLVDDATGSFTASFSTNLGNANYSLTVQLGGGGARNWVNSPFSNRSTSSIQIFTYNTSNALHDYDSTNETIHGDLA